MPSYAARRRSIGKQSLFGEILTSFTSIFVSAIRLQPAQWKMCWIMPGFSSRTKVERVHLISMRQVGQVGGST